jgi:hypothetical protein
MRQKGEIQQCKSKRSGERGYTFTRTNEAELQKSAAEVKAELDKDGEKKKNEAGDSPIERAAGKNKPPEEEEEKGEGFYEAAAQIVEDLPSGDGADWVRN